MAAHRKKLAFAAMTVAVMVGVLDLTVGGRRSGEPESAQSSAPQSELAEKAMRAASKVSDRLAPVVSWKLRMLRSIGWY